MALKKSAVYGISISAAIVVVAITVTLIVLFAGKKQEATTWACDPADTSAYQCSPKVNGPYKSQADCRCIFNVGPPGPDCKCVYDPTVQTPQNRFATVDECKADGDAKCGWMYACE